MKTLQEYINTISLPNRLHYPYNQLKEQLEDYNCNNENADIMYCKDYNEYNKYIIENLKSYNVSKVINKIKEYIKTDINFEYDNADKKENFNIIINKKIYNKYKDKINNILSFYNYYITTTDPSYFNVKLYVEPLYSESADDFVYNKCNGILYHFVIPNIKFSYKNGVSSFTAADISKKSASIEKSGLRIKSSKYRYFPEKIFCFCDKETNLLKVNDNLLKYFLLCIYNNKKENIKKALDNLNIFKIDLNKISHFKPNFYNDSGMILPHNCVYTFTNIPVSCLTKLNQEQLDKFKAKMMRVL